MGSVDVEDWKGSTLSVGGGAISCSICLEAVTECGDRSTAKLQCGHQFHLDCIGSAFNVKGVMQCPNCRKVEKGQWLFSNGYRAFADFSLDEWPHDEDIYDIGYSEIPLGFHWCPFRGFAQLSSSFEETGRSSSSYQDLFGQHAIFADQTSASSTAHACPYLALHAYVQPQSSSNNSDGVVEAFHHHWARVSGPPNISSHGFPSTEVHHNWEPHSSSTSEMIQNSDQSSAPSAAQRSVRSSVDSDGLPRLGAFVPQFIFGHGSSRAGTSVVPSAIPPYIVSARGHARRLHPYQQHLSPAMSGAFSMPPRRSVPRSAAPLPSSHLGNSAASSFDRGGFYPTATSAPGRNHQDGESSGSRQNHARGWEGELFTPFPWLPVDGESHWWGPFHRGQTLARGSAGGGDSLGRSNWWPVYSTTMDRTGGGVQPNGVSSSDRSSLWQQMYFDSGGQVQTEGSSQHHVRLSRMPPFM